MASILNSDLFAFQFPGENDDETGDVDLPGQICELQRFDSHINSEGDRIVLRVGARGQAHWDDDEEERGRDAAMILTRRFDSARELERVDLTVHSTHIIKAMQAVIKTYPGVDLHSRFVVMTGLPRCLFHYRNEFDAYNRTLGDPVSVRHVVFALRYMQHSLRQQLATFRNFVELRPSEQTLDFQNLWMVFRPEELVYEQKDGVETISRLKSMEMACYCRRSNCSDHYWVLTVANVSFDGTDFGYVQEYLQILPYDGYMRLDHLHVSPFEYHPRKREITEALKKRGNKFVSLRGSHHLQYEGIIQTNMHNQLLPFAIVKSIQVKSRVQIDVKAYAMAMPAHKTTLDTIDLPQKIQVDGAGAAILSQDDVLTCQAWTAGFCFSNKSWGRMRVDLLQEVDFNSSAFDALILPPEQKAMVKSLVTAHANQENEFDDVIKGKGKGIVFLLHGVPGVGKTLTAESVADVIERPLYTITSGDLGTDARTVDKSLSVALALASSWNAIVLIDEADVFLAQRKSKDLERSAVVSVFLRLLEYYEGIMFLTKNRMSTIDQAFKSRIHLAIKYHSLSALSRQKLWELFIKAAAGNAEVSWLSQETLAELSAKNVNGRQIKNAVRTAHAFAVSEDTNIQLKYLEMALDALEKFNKDFDDSKVEDEGTADLVPQRGYKRKRVDYQGDSNMEVS